ncbi:MAG: DUF305 domain-containing protein [Clostridium sp.]
MKKLFIMGLLLTQLLTVTAFASPSTPKDSKEIKEKPSFELNMDEGIYMKEYSKVFEKMKKDMTSAPVTGNVDIDFLSAMIPHHEGAIGMSEAILKEANDNDVKKLAQNIISEQNNEVKTMQALLEKLKKENTVTDKDLDQKYIREYQEIINGMFKEMNDIKATKTPCVDYLKQMLHHHEAGIEMAEDLLKYSNTDEVKALAQNIIKNQKAQEPLMKDLLKKLSSPAK